MRSVLKDYGLYLLFILVGVVLYDRVGHALGNELYTKGRSTVYRGEVVWLVYIATLLYVPGFKRVFRYGLPMVLLLGIYGAFDLFFAYFKRVPTYSDFANVGFVWEFAPHYMVPVLLWGTVLAVYIGMYVAVLRSHALAYVLKDVAVRAVWAVTGALFLSTKLHAFDYTPWSQKFTVLRNGRISSFVYFSFKQYDNRLRLQQACGRVDVTRLLYQGKIETKRNVHIVVLESFIHPGYLNVDYDKPPLYERFWQQADGEAARFSLAVSPVYGGNTAQAEFELLTGIKAFGAVGSTEFNVMRGGKINGFLARLQAFGYDTYATVASGSEFFNAPAAYKSLGFSRVVFLEEAEDFRRKEGDEKIFDGDMFAYNLRFLRKRLSTSERPFVNYLLGMYGHVPYHRNKTLRPDVIHVTDALSDASIERIANQFYYRTEALAHFLRELTVMDPQSLVLVISDHLPSVLDERIRYRYPKEYNLVLLIDKGHVIPVPLKPYFEIPWMLWDRLIKAPQQRNITDTQMRQAYEEVLCESL